MHSSRTILIAMLALGQAAAQQHTLGVGVYPGDPAENFAPVMRSGSTAYRNLALRRAAWHSSSYDYNLTAQLITDGIKETALPRWVSVSTSREPSVGKVQREWLLDGNWVTSVSLNGPNVWVQVELGGGAAPLEVDRIDLDGTLRAPSNEPEVWACVVSGSDDGETWKVLGRTGGMARPTGELRPSVKLDAPARSRFYRIALSDPRIRNWTVNEVAFFRQNRPLNAGGPHHFSSAWMSAGTGEEWVYVDLGAPATFDRVALHWLRRPAEAVIETSDDAARWTAIQTLAGAAGKVDDVKLARPARGRYVRVLMKRASDGAYILSELEVFGRGGQQPEAKSALTLRADGRLPLAGGEWRVERDSQVKAAGPAIATAGYNDANWLVATVPGTVLTSYLNAGAIPDPNFSDNQLMVSDSFFHADFWYRNEFQMPSAYAGRRVWLNFDGINWKAEVFLNGERLGRIEGGFQRGRFDVTGKLKPGVKNALAVRIEKQAAPGSIKEKTFETPDKNGGALGLDNPTFHASIGWDWIPTIRGRNTGIWNNVFLSASGPVTVDHPAVSTVLPLPDISRAEVTVEATLQNHEARAITGSLRGRFGDTPFEIPATLQPRGSLTVKRTLTLRNPKLWWPVGYGRPDMYTVHMEFTPAEGDLSDKRTFPAGVRQFTYSEEGGALRIWINGRRFIPKGGNWGFAESMLRYRGREYDAAVRYHREMNFNMIRNWVGQIGEEEFYQACDRHGVVVWQDFWLANPWDGPDPANDAMFLRNVEDRIRMIRHHPSVGLYCGRNEGYPPKAIDDGIRELLARLHPGMHYISSSADQVVSGHGPYQAQTAKHYFTQRATPKFHSEMGMPNIVTADSLRQMMREADMWPQGRVWGMHDFTLAGAQGGAAYRARIDKSYGGAQNVADWVSLAQFVNYEGYRAMFEAQSKNRMGLLIWMSHPTWPSFVWQTYDYYLEPTAAYFAAKKASEPLHIQWNPVNDTVEVVNYSAGQVRGLTARVRILGMDGAVKWEKSATLDSAEDSVAAPIKMEYPAGLSAVHFLRLDLMQGGNGVSENFYWRGVEEDNFRALRELPKVRIEQASDVEWKGETWKITTTLRNTASSPALMVRLKAVRETTGDRILPAIFSDGYLALMPGEERTITTELRDADTRGEKPRIVVDGFNLQ